MRISRLAPGSSTPSISRVQRPPSMTARIPADPSAGVHCAVMNGSPRLRPAPGRAADMARRSVQFVIGLAGMGLGVATMLEANIGVGPWSVFHDGLARVTPLSFGQALMAVGVGVALLAWRWTGQRPGPGTVLNMLLVGPFVDLFRASGVLPAQEALLPGVAQLLA